MAVSFSPVYSNALQESANSILYNGLIEELVDVLQITDKQLVVRCTFLSLSLLVSAVLLSQYHSRCEVGARYCDCNHVACVRRYHEWLMLLI